VQLSGAASHLDLFEHPASGGLGEIQKIVLMEFEGPRRRQIEMRLLAEA